MEKILLPRLGLTMEDARLVRWLKSEGEQVKRGEPIAEIEMEKTSAEIESPCDGFLTSIVVAEGETALVNSVLAYVATSAAEREPPLDVAAPQRQTSPASGGVAVSSRATVVPELREEGSVRAAPASRRLARELGVHLAAVAGTGPGGRIMPEDIQRAHDGRHNAAERRVEKRRPIITALMRSVTTIPHINVCREVRADGLLRVKRQLEAVTYTDILVKVLAAAAEQHPPLRTALVGDNVRETAGVNVGLVVAASEGLVIPVLKDAAAKPLETVSSELKDLARRARSRQLRPDELEDATVTLSNLGMHGVDFFTAVIPYGQVAVLAVGRVREGSALGGPALWLNLVVDHRLVDGVAAARALVTMAELLEPEAVERLAAPGRGQGANG